VRTALSVFLLVLIGLVAAAPSAAAQDDGSASDPNGDGLRYVGSTAFRADPDRGVIAVTVDLDLTNVQPNERTAAGVLEYFFPGVVLPVLDSAQAVRVTSGGADLPVAVSEQPGATDAAEVDFPTNLRFGQQRQLRVTYEVPSAPARSDDVTRVNPAYVAFPAFAVGDAGLASVTVEVPPGYEPEIVSSDDSFGASGNATSTAADIERPEDWWAIVTAQDDERLNDLLVEEDGRSFHIRSWPGDDEWARFVADYVGGPVDELAGLVGEPWIDGEPYDVVEAYSPYLYGYAGWFEPIERRIVIGEELDPSVVLHELAHGWFNGDVISERWINEGLANAYAARTLSAIGQEAPELGPAPDDIPFPLAGWADALAEADSEAAADVEAYGYDTSWFVVDRVIQEIGIDQMKVVLDNVFARQPAYAGDRAETLPSALVDDRRFLDLVERIGGSAEAAALLERYVLADADLALLDDRAAAIVRYDELAAAGDDWAVPLGIRRAMEGWNFTQADQGIDAATVVLDQRQVLDPLVARLELTLPDRLEEAYESARLPLDDLTDEMTAHIEAARAIERISNGSGGAEGLVARVGLWGTDLNPLRDQARAAFDAGDPDRVGAKVAAYEAAQKDAERDGWTRIGAGVLALAALAGLALVIARRRGRGPSPEEPPEAAEPTPDAPDGSPEVEDVYAPPVRYDPSVTHPPPPAEDELPRRARLPGP
jgi:hypothetical protein